jgi:hypothetical protein
MVVERCVVEMVLERGETRHDIVVNGLKEIALCGKVHVCIVRVLLAFSCRGSAALNFEAGEQK